MCVQVCECFGSVIVLVGALPVFTELTNFHRVCRGALGSQAAWGLCGRMLSDCQGSAVSERASNEKRKKERRGSPLRPLISLSTLDHFSLSRVRCEVVDGLRMRNVMQIANRMMAQRCGEQLDSPPEPPRCCLKTVHQCHCLLSLYRWGRSLTAELQKRLTLKHVKSKYIHLNLP